LSWGQTAFPIQITNTTGYADSDVYVAVVGQKLNATKDYVWLDLSTGQQNLMDTADNTILGPPNSGPNGSSYFADCFMKLSDIPNKSFPINGIQGCRIYLSLGNQLYLYFFAQDTVKGYAGPNSLNPNDPSTGILYEFIELTFDNTGFYANTSRVDSYHRSIGLGLTSDNGSTYVRVGELLDHQTITTKFSALAPPDFSGCINTTTGVISQPSKTPAYFNSNGAHHNYFKSYIDSIWAKYANEDLLYNAGNLGKWKGRVSNDSLIFTCDSCAAGNQNLTGTIVKKPTTIEIIDGSGVLASGTDMDKNMQKEICAAINRHVVDVTTPNVGLQIWSDSSKYYKTFPYNWYAKFWHHYGISIDNLAYGFAYDDVFDQSSSIKTTTPDSMRIFFGNQNITSTQEIAIQSNDVFIYPNPVRDELHFNFVNNDYQNLTVLLIEIASGKMVLSKKLIGNSIQIKSHLSSGAYFVKLVNEEGENIKTNTVIIK
jgi:hypothetical protein